MMSWHRRLFRFRFLLSLSLIYGCTSQPASIPPASPSALPRPNPRSTPAPQARPTPQASPTPAAAQTTSTPPPSSLPASASPQAPADEIHLLSTAEIDTLKASGLVEANNRFSWELFHRLYAANPSKNLFVSPLSAALALQMTLQGADGTTLTGMKQALGLGQLENQTLLENVPLLLRKLRRPAEDINLEVANSFWANQNYQFVPDFLKAVKGAFQAEAAAVDMADPATVKRINQWTATATHDKIPSVVEKIERPDERVAFLINAIYFNAKWTHPFEKAETIPKPFILADGSQKQVQMMRQFGYMPYLPPSADFPYQGIALPYGKQGRLRMYVFLPTTGKTLANLQQDLQSHDFATLQQKFVLEGGSLELPRFKLSWQQKLNDALTTMGMGVAFDSKQADFGKMTHTRFVDGNIFLDYVEQFSYVDVKEEGTEAAAVTVVAVSDVASSAPQRAHSMVVDHPFVFLICDEETGQIVFMGSITDPEAAGDA